VLAGLATLNGDNVVLTQLQPAIETPEEPPTGDELNPNEDGTPREESKLVAEQQAKQSLATPKVENENHNPQGQLSARSVIQINVTLDSSLDTEKLEKQLSLLRRFGAL
jgi:hypothetical protein